MQGDRLITLFPRMEDAMKSVWTRVAAATAVMLVSMVALSAQMKKDAPKAAPLRVNADGTMNLARTSDFNSSSNMLYGSQVLVSSGTYAGQALYMVSPDITVVNGAGTDPSQWITDVVDANVSLLAPQGGQRQIEERMGARTQSP